MTSDSLDVTAVVVGPLDSPYLVQTLIELAGQTRAPQRILLGVLPGEGDAAQRQEGIEDLLAEAGWGPDSDGNRAVVSVVGLADPGGFGAAVQEVLDAQPAPERGWLWLLHDDAAPHAEALAALVATADRTESAAIIGAKQIEWDNPDELISVGVSPTIDGQRVTFIEDGEIDQGQHDGREDVYAVGTAGMLIRRKVWSRLGGPDPALGPFGDGADLCRRARLAGGRVLVAPRAKVRHARAGYFALRTRAGSPDLRGADSRRSFRARRTALLHARLVNAPLIGIPAVVLAALVLAPIRSLWRLVRTEPRRALDELLATLAALIRPGAVVRARRRAARTSTLSPRRLAPLRATWREAWQQRRLRRLQAAAQRRAARAPSELEMAERAAVATRRRLTFSLTLAIVAAVAAVTVAPVALSGPLIGGALAPADGTFTALWQAATGAWIATGDGYPGPADPFLGVLALLSTLTGGPLGVPVQVTVGLVLLLAMPLAAISAWFAAGAASRSVLIRAWAGAVWALGPPLLLALTDGRLGSVLAHLALPLVALGVARALGVDRRDVVVSGMVGARRLPVAPDSAPRISKRERRAALAAVGSATVAAPGTGEHDDLEADAEQIAAEQVDGEPREQIGDDVEQSAHENDERIGDEPREQIDDAPGDDAPGDDAPAIDEEISDERADGAPDAQPEPARLHATVISRASGTGSLGAAAGAGLAFTVASAGAPVLLPAGLICLTVLALSLGLGRTIPVRRARLLLVAIPAVVALGPIWLAALRVQDGWRLLLADPGVPLPAAAPHAWLTILAQPATPSGYEPGALGAWLLPLCSGAVLLAAAFVALFRGPSRTAVVRIGWLVAIAGLATALVSSRTVVGLGRGQGELSGVDEYVTGWAGPGTSLVLLGLLIAAVTGLSGLRRALSGVSFGWRQIGAAVLTVALVAGVVASASVWIRDVLTDRGEQIAYGPRGDDPVPALGLTVQGTDTAARVLALTATFEGIDAQVWRANGPQLTETATVLSLARAQRHQHNHEPDAADAQLATIVAELATGSIADAGPPLNDHAIAVLVVPPADSRATGVPQTDDAARSRLVAQLDAVFGLERVTENAAGVIWRVNTPGSAPTGRAQVRSNGENLSVLTSSNDVLVGHIDAAGADRVLVLAERRSSAWRAELDGRALRAVPEEWAQAFAIPDGASGDLVVRYQPLLHRPWQLLTLLVLGFTALLAVPTGRRRGGGRT